VVVTAVWAAVAVPVLGWRFLDAPVWGVALESVAYLALGLLLARCRPLVTAVAGLTPIGRGAVLLGAALLLGAQLAPSDERRVFPLARYDMYSFATGDVADETVVEGVRPTGERVAVDFDRLFPTLTHGRLSSLLREHDEAVADDRPGAVAELDGLLRAIGREWNRRHPDRALQRVELRELTLSLRDWPERRTLRSRLLASVDADSR
jgi:hypothetical protein